MKKIFFPFLILIISLNLISCSTTKDTTTTKTNTNDTDSLYVFDSVTINDSTENETDINTNVSNVKLYIVQIGAFTTKDKAEIFANESRNKITYKLEVEFSKSVNLFVVQLKPFYNKKKDAETVRNKLWKKDSFKDAWILTVIR